jgi:hypothetical protein
MIFRYGYILRGIRQELLDTTDKKLTSMAGPVTKAVKYWRCKYL